jgi:hypothetical protein
MLRAFEGREHDEKTARKNQAQKNLPLARKQQGQKA